MFKKQRPDVLVVGAGPVGLFAALVLARRGVHVQIVDKEWRTGAHSYALALHNASLRLLEEVGLRERVLEGAHRVRSIGLYDGARRRATLPLGDLEDGVFFILVLRQNVFEAILEEALQAEGVTVSWDHEASELRPGEDGVTVRVDRLDTDSVGYTVAHAERIIARTKEVQARFVIGADGYHSDVRQALATEFADLGETQHFAVFEFRTDADLQHEMRLVLDETTTNALWPLPGGYARWSFQLENFEASEATRTKDRFVLDLGTAGDPLLSEDNLRRLIEARAPWFTGSIDEILWSHVVRFERRLVRSFGEGRLWLAGDAAHMTGPVGVQSMNVGLREAADLAAMVAGILHGEVPPDRLQAYGRARLAQWHGLFGLDGGYEGDEQTDLWIRKQRARLLPCMPASGRDLDRLMQFLRLRPAAKRPAHDCDDAFWYEAGTTVSH